MSRLHLLDGSRYLELEPVTGSKTAVCLDPPNVLLGLVARRLCESPRHYAIMPIISEGELMAKRQPTASRVTITDSSEGFRIVIPCRRSLFVIAFLALWICGWGVAEVMVAKQFLGGDAPPEGEAFMLVWLGVWTLGGGVAIYAWLWQLMGKEIVTVRGQTFTVRRDIGGFGLSKEYDLVQMRDLRIGPIGMNPVNVSSSLQLWGVGGGVIVFEHGARTARFGAGLDEAEAKQVVAAITKRFRIPIGTTSKTPPQPTTHTEMDVYSGF